MPLPYFFIYRTYGMSRWQDANERRCTGRMGKFLLLQNVHFHHPWWSYVAVASYRDI